MIGPVTPDPRGRPMTGANPWSDAIIARLKELAAGADYHSNADMAAWLNREFGTAFTRNAIIGKRLRLGLAGKVPPKPASPRRRRIPKPRPVVLMQPRSHTLVERIQARVNDLAVVPQPEPVLVEPPIGQRCTLMQLTMDTCHWPYGDPATPEFYFCGGMALAEQPYCAYHCRIAYQPLRAPDPNRQANYVLRRRGRDRARAA